jgi:hypothetical protein
VNTLQRNIGPILLFLGIVALGLVGIAWWVLLVRDTGGFDQPANQPSRSVATRNQPAPTYTTDPARARVSDPYSGRKAVPSKNTGTARSEVRVESGK